ncbi:hypothetical protein [Streptomyces sp. NPDC097981]|uniref:hypothetical protein n=1 Tax=Streptomyces sp. NPDC097981 TaxID=3155428 RepID=UPI003323612A
MTGTAPAPRVVISRRTLTVDFDDHADPTIVDVTRTSGGAVTQADPARPSRPSPPLRRPVSMTCG